VLVLDTYSASAEALAALPRSSKLALMHGSGPVPAGATVLLPDGAAALRDACLRPQYWDLPERRHRPRVESVLVTTGGGDPGGAGGRLALAALEVFPGARVGLVRGPYADPSTPPRVEPIVAPDSLLEELLRADVALSGAGQTMLEACAAATPTVAIALVEDQRDQGARAGEAGAVLFVPEEGVAAALDQLAAPEARRRLAERAREVVDGRGALRVARRIAELGAASESA
jgi:spore coat polysaccharide biosynthesis predicted glycosyltransferase SpsG